MHFCRFRLPTFLVWTLLFGTVFSVRAAEVYQETLRPQYHFSARSGWINDPNGLVYYDGTYHLFFQYEPRKGKEEKFWGHAVSRDLVHWQELANGIRDNRGFKAFSGSAVVDWKNTSGFQTGENLPGNPPPIVAVYTAWGGGQCLAYSCDAGKMFRPYEGNPVLTLPNDSLKKWKETARDPKLFWYGYEPESNQSGTENSGGYWVMLLYQNVDGKGGFGFYRSADLKQWKFLGHMPGFYVCPDLFELAVDGDSTRKKWVIMDWAQYAIGTFDGEKFEIETGPIEIDHGKNCSANQTWSDMPASDPRRIQIAWMQYGKYPGMPFDQQLTFPRRLTLRSTSDGVRLVQNPIREIESLRGDGFSIRDAVLRPGENRLEKRAGDLWEVHLSLTPEKARSIELAFLGQTVRYDVATKTLHGPSGGTMKLRGGPGGRIDLCLLIDRTSIEIFADSGENVLSSCFIPDQEKQDLSLSAEGGPARIERLEVWPLRSIWK